jgi:hypothetical protein
MRKVRLIFRVHPFFNHTLGTFRHINEPQSAAFSGTVYPYNLSSALDEIAHSWQHKLKTDDLTLTQRLNALKPHTISAGFDENTPVAYSELDIR